MKFDVVVIGAGVSGITAAITLAQSGRSVALLEKSPRTAPLVRGFSRRGVHFDTGFHYTGGLAAGEPLDVFLRYLGVAGRITSFPFDAEGFDLFRCENPDFEFRFPVGYERLEQELCRAFPGETAAIASYLEQMKVASAALPYLNLDLEMESNAPLQRVLGPSLQETLDRLTGNELLKALLSTHCLLYGVSGHEVPFLQHAAVVGSYYHSVRGIRGGGESLAKAFDARLAELGVEVMCSSEVEAIEVAAGGGVSGVRLASGEVVAGSSVVSTLHPRLLLELVPQGAFRPGYGKRLSHLEETVSAFICFAVTSEPLPALAGANRFLLPDPASCLDLGARPVGEGPLYLSAAYRGCDTDPHGFVGISPAQFSDTSRWASTRRGSRPEEYRRLKEQGLARMQRQVERSLPEAAGKIVSLEGATPLTLRDYCSSPLGGLYGVKHMVGQFNPSPATRIPGLVLAGQGVVAPGVMGAVLSGLLACGTILGHGLLRKELKKCC